MVYQDGETTNARHNFFSPKNKAALANHNNNLRANDTSTATAYYPYSSLEKTILTIEDTLNAKKFKSEHPFLGTDIKIMEVRQDNNYNFTLCLPIISHCTPNARAYTHHLEGLQKIISQIISKELGDVYFTIYLNTRDNPLRDDFYLICTGSSIESGDEGMVGRGNRYNGLINFQAPNSMEAYHGKNPVYHVGKLYTSLAHLITRDLYLIHGISSRIWLTSRMGDNLNSPWKVHLESTSRNY